MLLTVKAAIRLAPSWTLRHAARRGTAPGDRSAVLVARLTDVVESLGTTPLLMSDCLSRAVTVLVLARLAGVRPTLVIGARRVGDALDAHAWLECGGAVVPWQDTRAYARLWAAS